MLLNLLVGGKKESANEFKGYLTFVTQVQVTLITGCHLLARVGAHLFQQQEKKTVMM